MNVIAFYNTFDPDLGTFFLDCYLEWYQVVNSMNNTIVTHTCYRGVDCSQNNFLNYVSNNSYIDVVVWYTHGSIDNLFDHCGKSFFVSNYQHPTNNGSLVYYTFACLSASKVGVELVRSGKVSAYLGYYEKIEVPCDAEVWPYFIESFMLGLKIYLYSFKDFDDLTMKVLELFEKNIEELQLNNKLEAALLLNHAKYSFRVIV